MPNYLQDWKEVFSSCVLMILGIGVCLGILFTSLALLLYKS